MPARVLIAEDNQTNLSLMAYLLRAYGYPVSTAADGQEAIDVAHRERPNLVLMDLHMPRMNGFEAMALLRRIPGLDGLPIVAVTASAMVGDREHILAQGFDGYLQKPIVPELFVQQVEAFIPAALRSTTRPPVASGKDARA